MDADVLPVETQATRFIPGAALEPPAGHALSLNEPLDKTLVLERDVVQALYSAAPVQAAGACSFPQGHHGIEILEERDDFPIAPDATLIERWLQVRRLRQVAFSDSASSVRPGYAASSSPPQSGQL